MVPWTKNTPISFYMVKINCGQCTNLLETFVIESPIAGNACLRFVMLTVLFFSNEEPRRALENSLNTQLLISLQVNNTLLRISHYIFRGSMNAHS